MVNPEITLEDLLQGINRAEAEGKKYLPLRITEAERIAALLEDAKYYLNDLRRIRMVEVEREMGKSLLRNEYPSMEAMALKKNLQYLDDFIMQLGGRSTLGRDKPTKNI